MLKFKYKIQQKFAQIFLIINMLTKLHIKKDI